MDNEQFKSKHRKTDSVTTSTMSTCTHLHSAPITTMDPIRPFMTRYRHKCVKTLFRFSMCVCMCIHVCICVCYMCTCVCVCV